MPRLASLRYLATHLPEYARGVRFARGVEGGRALRLFGPVGSTGRRLARGWCSAST